MVGELVATAPKHILLVCAGTGTQCASEDTLCAGSIVDELRCGLKVVELTDSALLAEACGSSGAGKAGRGQFQLGDGANGRRLLGIEALAGDVNYCAQMMTHDLLGEMGDDGAVRRAQDDRLG